MLLLVISIKAQKNKKKGESKKIIEESIADADPYNFDPYYG